MPVELENSAPDTEQPSTLLQEEVNTPKPSGMKLEEPEAKPKPLTVDEAVRKAAEDVAAPKAAEKPAKEVKPKAEPVEDKKPEQPRENGKFKAREPEAYPDQETQETSEAQAKEAEAGRDGDETRPSEGREDAPPARFLPRAKEKWAEADPDIRSEVKRMEAEFQKGREVFEEDRTFRKELREFEDMAKEHGTTVKDALKNYTAIDNLLKTNPVAGVERILASIGITPQQYADYVQNAPAEAPADPKVSQLEQTVRQLQQQLQGVTQQSQESQQQAQLSKVQTDIIAPFRASLGVNDRYEELEPDIAFFLNSDKVPSTLSAQRRLEVAYDMAERINPASYPERLKPATPDRPLNPAGKRSIRGAPGAGTSVSPKAAIVSIEDAVKAAMAER